MQLLWRVLKMIITTIIILVIDVFLWAVLGHVSRGASAKVMFVLTCAMMWLHVLVAALFIHIRKQWRDHKNRVAAIQSSHSSLLQAR